MQKIICSLLFLSSINLVGCEVGSKEENTRVIKNPDSGERAAQAKKTNDIAEDKAPLPTPVQNKIDILRVGNFHNNEVPEAAAQKQWFGLFKGQQGFYTAATKLLIERVHDPVLDGDKSDRTGWSVRTNNTDSAYLLLESMPLLRNATVPHITIHKATILPGEIVSFSYNGTEYALSATGQGGKKAKSAAVTGISNYNLFLTIKSQKKSLRQLLVTHKDFDDRMVEILFVGDIDGDGSLDFIIDTSRHYNMRSPALYLSGPAGQHAGVVKVGEHVSVGG